MADMSDLMKNFSSMMNGKEIPDNIKEMLNSFVSKSSDDNCEDKSNNDSHIDNSESSCNRSESSSPFEGIDFETMMKMQKIISSMKSSSNSSGANLLRSLKPYLKPSRQAKVDECIQLLSLEKAFSLMNNSNISNRW